jgi:hypothetical protein
MHVRAEHMCCGECDGCDVGKVLVFKMNRKMTTCTTTTFTSSFLMRSDVAD